MVHLKCLLESFDNRPETGNGGINVKRVLKHEMGHVTGPPGHTFKDINLRPFNINLDTIGLVLGENLLKVFYMDLNRLRE